MDVVIKVVGVVILSVLVIMLISVLLAWPIMWAWNYVMPYMFGFKVVTWGQAWCLSFLAGTFFKSSATNNNK